MFHVYCVDLTMSNQSIWGEKFRIELFSLQIITSSGITGRELLLLEDPQVAPFLPTLAPQATEAPELPCTVLLLPAAPTEEGRRCTDHRRRCTTPGRGRRTTEAKHRLIQAWKTAPGLQEVRGMGSHRHQHSIRFKVGSILT